MSKTHLTDLQKEIVAFMQKHNCAIHRSKGQDGRIYFLGEVAELWREECGKEIPIGTIYNLQKKKVMMRKDLHNAPYYRQDFWLKPEWRKNGDRS